MLAGAFFTDLYATVARWADWASAQIEAWPEDPADAVADPDELRPSPGEPTGDRGGNRVELRGIEPLTYSMRTSRATNCATAPGATSL